MRLLRAILDGFILRCPRCHTGRLFERGFHMYTRCPSCGLAFEHASGEITGGMGISISITLLIVIISALIIGLNPALPLVPFLAGMIVFTILFPILFYRSSRGMWVGFLYVTGDNDEGD